jgi:4-alpha-glucanotransferase
MQHLPIGFDPEGADAWVWQDCLAGEATIGTPPDEDNTLGQDWELPPFIPHKPRERFYEPFRQTLRAAFRHAAGLRIDYGMGLFRLCRIPKGRGAPAGVYVRYAADDLWAIVALESRRAAQLSIPLPVPREKIQDDPFVREIGRALNRARPRRRTPAKRRRTGQP